MVTTNQIVIQKYDTLDIDHLTVYEQYLVITNDQPYIAILYLLHLHPAKKKYHNMRYLAGNNEMMEVYDGECWLKIGIRKALTRFFYCLRQTIGLIFNRFRLFLSNKAVRFIPKAHYYGYYKVSFPRNTIKQINLHLQHGSRTESVEMQQIVVVPDENDEAWWALSKNFTWAEVEKFLAKLDKCRIDLDHELVQIKSDVLAICAKNEELKIFFRKLNLRINRRLINWDRDRLEDSSEELVSEGEDEGNLKGVKQ